MFRKMIRYAVRFALLAATATAAVVAISQIILRQSTAAKIQSVEQAPLSRVAVVFGAGLQRNGKPSAVLRDRVETAVELYQTGKVEKLLMSGDNRFVEYNEPAAMRDYAISLGVPDSAIVLDFAGRRTYDTCYRALHIFRVQDVILVTQSFHMPRALFTCNNLGLRSTGVAADVRQYGRRSYAYWNIREIPASMVAIWEVWVTRPLPVMGNPEPIFSTNRGPSRWLAGTLQHTPYPGGPNGSLSSPGNRAGIYSKPEPDQPHAVGRSSDAFLRAQAG